MASKHASIKNFSWATPGVNVVDADYQESSAMILHRQRLVQTDCNRTLPHVQKQARFDKKLSRHKETMQLPRGSVLAKYNWSLEDDILRTL